MNIEYYTSRLFDIGINADGSLHNPNGYPPETVRAAVLAVDARRHERRSQGAKRAALTRARRHQRRIWQAAKRIADRQEIGDRSTCYICGRGLVDTTSIKRGIGPECWQDVFDQLEALAPQNKSEPLPR
jgi:hypothetical protein